MTETIYWILIVVGLIMFAIITLAALQIYSTNRLLKDIKHELLIARNDRNVEQRERDKVI